MIEKHDLIGRRPGNDWDWSSRDFFPFIPCAVSVCPCNERNKCALPSKIDINSAGQCKTGLDFINNPPMTKKEIEKERKKFSDTF